MDQARRERDIAPVVLLPNLDVAEISDVDKKVIQGSR
jgi:hypothetical protein